MSTLATAFPGGGTGYDDHPDIEPDLNWKNELRRKIQDGLIHLVEEVRQERDSHWIHHAVDSHSLHMNEMTSQKYSIAMTNIRRLAQEQYEAMLERERLERRWAAGQVDPTEIESLAREQQMLMAALHNGRQQTEFDVPYKQSEEPVAGPSRTGGRGTTNEPPATQAYRHAADLVREMSQPPSGWYANNYAERQDEAAGVTGRSNVPWPRAGWAPPHDGTIKQHHIDAQAKSRQMPEIWHPTASATDEPIRPKPAARPKPNGKSIDRSTSGDRLSGDAKMNSSQAEGLAAMFGQHSSTDSVHDGDIEHSLMKQLHTAIARAGLGQDDVRKTPQLRPVIPPHLAHAHHLADRTLSTTPKPPGSFPMAPTSLRSVESIHYEQTFADQRTSTDSYMATGIPSALRATTTTPHPRTMTPSLSAAMYYEQSLADQRDSQGPAAMLSALRASTFTPHLGPRTASAALSTAMQVVDPSSFTLDDDRSSIHSTFRPPSVLGRGRSDTLRPPPPPPAAQPSRSWNPIIPPEIPISQPSPQRTPTLDEMVLVASDEGDSDWEASAFDSEDVERLMKEGMEQIMSSGDAGLEQLLSSDSTPPEELAPTKAEKIQVQATKVVETETETEKEDMQKKNKGGKLNKKQEAKKKEQEAKQKAQDARQKAQEARQKEQGAKQKETKQKEQEEAKRKQEEARRLEEQKKQREEEEARHREEELKQMMEEARKRELLRKREEEARETERLNEEKLIQFRKQQEEARRQYESRQRSDSTARFPEALKKQQVPQKTEQDGPKKETEAGRKDGDAKRREEDLKKKEDELKRKEEDLKHREQEIARKEKQEEARRREEEKRRKPGAPRKKEDELRDKERELQRQADENQKKEDELRNREEALNRRAVEMFMKMKALQEEFRHDWLQMGGKLL